ncbi:ribonuclease H-like domain-containing protein [Tanacetum coccineum]
MAVKDDVNKNGDSSKKIIGSSSDLNLFFGDPLYLHPNDTSGLPIVTIKLTVTENDKMWSIAMTFAIRNHNKLGFIDGSYKRDTDNLALANQWDMCNSVVVTWILNSLSSYLFAGAICAKSACEMWDDLKETYDKKQFVAMNVTSAGTTKPTAIAFAAKTFDNNKRRFNNNNFKGSGSNSNSNNRGPNPNLKCTNCNKIGHTMDRCFELVGYPTGYVKSYFNANTRHVSSNNVTANVHDNSVSSNNATSSNSPYTVSLLSVHKLSKDSKLFVGFDESNCYIQDLKAYRNVGTSKKFNGLFLFDVDNACKIVSNNFIASCFISKTLWHQRLGHPADQVLNVLKTTLNLDSPSTSDRLCDTCNKAKQTRKPFPPSEHKSTKIGELMHLDLSPDIKGNDDSEATFMDENNTHPEGIVPNETDFVNDFYENSEFNSEVEDLPVHTVRRSSRQTKLPTSLNDFVIEGKVKYGVEKVFNIKDLGSLKYFFGIKVIKTGNDLCLSQRKYFLELLKEYGLRGCKPVSTPMEPNSVLPYIVTKDDPLLDNINAQYMHSPLKSHLNCAMNVLRYLKNAPEAEYRSLSSAACEIIWIQKLLFDLKTKTTLPVDLFCDNKSALQLVVNPVFHERSKHFEVYSQGLMMDK